MKTFAIALFLLTGAWLMLASPASKPVLGELNAEAHSLKSNTVAWTGWNATTDKILHENETSRMNRTVGGAGLADLQPAKLPLAFLVWRFEGERTNNYRRLQAYLPAMAGSADARRIEALLELWALPHGVSDRQWIWALAKAATPEWAFQQIREAIATNAEINRFSLAFLLLNRFAAELPVDLRQPAYDQIIRTWPNEPGTNRRDEELVRDYYDVLLRIDRERARKELIEHYRGRSLDSVYMLDKYAGPSRMVAEAARKWLAEASARDKEIYGMDLKHLILFSDPDIELKPTLNRIRALLRIQTKPEGWDELDTLTRAVIELNLPTAADDLADFATQPAIPIETRYNILDWLVKRRHPALPGIFAWWLREDDTGKHWLRNEAEKKWGGYGKALLTEGDRVNEQREKK